MCPDRTHSAHAGDILNVGTKETSGYIECANLKRKHSMCAASTWTFPFTMYSRWGRRVHLVAILALFAKAISMCPGASRRAHFRSLFDRARSFHSESALRVLCVRMVAAFTITSARALRTCAGGMQTTLSRYLPCILADPRGFVVLTYKIYPQGTF